VRWVGSGSAFEIGGVLDERMARGMVERLLSVGSVGPWMEGGVMVLR
jgi:hypothetical protein